MDYSVGLLNGKAQEFVYNPDGSTISRLDWTLKNVVMFNAGMAIQPWKGVTLGLRGSMNIEGKSVMDDYDFDTGFCPPSTPGHDLCHSNSDTKLRRATMLDAYVSYDLYRSQPFGLAVIGGYKRDQYRWQAIGGTANYATLPPGLGISYEQTWSSPYLGLGVSSTFGAFTFNGRVIGSSWGKGDDSDTHHLRSLLFLDDYPRARMIQAEAGIAYRMNQYVSLTADYRFQQWGTAKGPTTINDLTGGGNAFIPGDAAGGNVVSHMVSLGAKVDLYANDVAPVYAAAVKAPPVARPILWSGFTLGATSGFEFQRDRWTTTGLTLASAPPLAATASRTFHDTGDRAGIFAGYQWQSNSFVFGVEADIGKANTSATSAGIPGTNTAAALAGSGDSIMVTAGWDGSVRLRGGFLAMPNLLAYATGGVAFQQVELGASCPASTNSVWCTTDHYEEISRTRAGWTLGAGYEWAFAGGWFTRGEYRYSSFNTFSQTFFAGTPAEAVSAKIHPSNQRISFGLGARF